MTVPLLRRHCLPHALVPVVRYDDAVEHLIPRVHLIDVNDDAGYRIVEYPFLVLDGDAFLRDVGEGGPERVAALAEEQAVIEETGAEDEQAERRDRNEKVHQVDAARFERQYLILARKPAEHDDRRKQEGHRKGKRQKGRA